MSVTTNNPVSNTAPRSIPRTIVIGIIAGLAVALSSLLHEVGHWVTATMLGFKAYVDYLNVTRFWEAPNPTPGEAMLFILNGPLVTVIISVIGLALCIRQRRSTSALSTVIRAVTAATLPALFIQLAAVTGFGSNPPDIAGVVSLLGVSNPVRVVIILAAVVLTVVGAVLFGRWTFRVDHPALRPPAKWRVALVIVFGVVIAGVEIANVATLSQSDPGPWGILGLYGLMALMAIAGAILVPWRDPGTRPLIRRDLVPIMIAYGVQVGFSIGQLGPYYALTMLPLLGYGLVGVAAAARTRRKGGLG